MLDEKFLQLQKAVDYINDKISNSLDENSVCEWDLYLTIELYHWCYKVKYLNQTVWYSDDDSRKWIENEENSLASDYESFESFLIREMKNINSKIKLQDTFL